MFFLIHCIPSQRYYLELTYKSLEQFFTTAAATSTKHSQTTQAVVGNTCHT
jgi:hypothetical protein